MPPLSLPAEDLLAWNELTTGQWHAFTSAHPQILKLPCDIRQSGTVAHLLQHIVAVELRYAERLASQPETDYAAIPYSTPDEILHTHRRATTLLRSLLDDPTLDWNAEIEFNTITMGRLRATRRNVLVHALLHSIRHFAQLATLIRQNGFEPDWPMDFLFVAAQPA